MILPADMARIHALAFAGQGRAWREEEFADLMATGHVICVGDHMSFSLSRLIADEAELLTLATLPAERRQGAARRILAALETDLRDRGAVRQFLEVAEDNMAARALYASCDYVETGRRGAYYRRPDDTRIDALILTKPLDQVG
ncbi:GNAT family N-acetyltransferase [Roseovarius pelagicus]|uniref:GNAT family N-acetyltransferase n=1 Tax=Roseovarius pelagicus TaxID=2980108 RepID=A0ABY6DFU7_9RHOB|nr:GNAT family N-acetyltransferase [Roseovarius pelagicus]UXX85017.1 GNAT family N-acetyltransferase [Roseovarius pelagicus]